MQTALIIIHVVISLALIVVVLMQHGKQQGLSGAIAGGAETFFGKNKGRTIDAALKKITAVVAILFVVSSIGLAAYSINKEKADIEELNQAIQGQIEAEADSGAVVEAETDADANAEAETEANTDANAE